MTDELTDREAINHVLDSYAAAIDDRDFGAVAAFFTADAHLDYTSSGGPAATRDEVVEWLRTSLPAVTLTQHLLTNRRIRVDGNTATARTELLNPLLFSSGDATELVLLGGRYEDRLVRTDAGWRITHRVHTTSWTAGPVPAQLVQKEL